MSALLPTLTANGWVSEIFKKADIILGHFFVTENSQSNQYKDQLSSLPYLVQQFGNKPDELAIAVESKLLSLFNRYFGTLRPDTTVSIKVTINNDNDATVAKYDLKVDASVTADGKFYSLGKIVNVENSVIMNIIEINNG